MLGVFCHKINPLQIYWSSRLLWMVNGGMFKIVGESLLRSFQNTIIMRKIVTYVVNDAFHSAEVKQELIGDVVEL
jgi:hypothetical protein